MVNVLTETIINKPIDVVADYSSNPDNAPAWYENIKTIEWVTDKPLEVGSKLAFKAKFMGKELSYIYEVVEWVKNDILIMRTADGPFPMETIYTWEAKDEQSTLMKLRNRGNPKGFSSVFSPFMGLAMKKANKKDLKKLKRILEEHH